VAIPRGVAKVAETGKSQGTLETEAAEPKLKAGRVTGEIYGDFRKNIPVCTCCTQVMAFDAGIDQGLHPFSNDLRAAISSFC